RDIEPETQKHYLRLIHSEARRLTDLIDEFLDLQRIEQGSFELALEPFELSELLREETQLFSGQSEKHTIELAAPGERIEVLGERDRIAQVMANLLSNAIKYSPDGGPIRVAAEALGDDVRVSVIDPGLGIPEDQR